MQNNQTVYSGNNVIQHDAKSAVEPLINKTYRKWFPDIEYAEEGKTKSHGQGSCRDGDHGDQHTDNLINNYEAGILMSRLFAKKPGEQETEAVTTDA